jgi:hypothetical protein
MRVKILPRLASSAPFLCLIVAHLEWPDMGTSESVELLARYGRKDAPNPVSIPPGWVVKFGGQRYAGAFVAEEGAQRKSSSSA